MRQTAGAVSATEGVRLRGSAALCSCANKLLKRSERHSNILTCCELQEGMSEDLNLDQFSDNKLGLMGFEKVHGEQITGLVASSCRLYLFGWCSGASLRL